MSRFLRLAVLAAVSSCFVVSGLATTAAANEAASAQIGEPTSKFTFKDIRFLSRELADLGKKKAYVVVFTTLDCPLVQRYMPRVVEMEAKYRDQGVQFVAMNVGPNDTLVEVAQQALDLGAPFPFCKDWDGNVVRALGVERTPEVVILDAEQRIVYRGRIDSQYRLGGVRPDEGREDLREAIEDVLADREVRVAETPVDGCKITVPTVSTPVENVNYAEHVAGILQTHCVECHRPNTTAPFSLTSYEDAAGYAEMIAEVVREQRMPPNYASEQHGEFVNIRSLTADERALVVAWATGDRAKGDVSQLPPPVEFADTEWSIGEPDLILPISKPVKVPADGYVAYKYLFLPHVFPEDTWVQGVEILPGDHRVVHHANLAAVKVGGANYTDANFITGFVPGGEAMTMDPGLGFMIPKGSVLVLQSHYVTVGEEVEDVTRVGLRFARGTIQKEIKHFRVTTGDFAIPPGDPHHRVVASRTLECEATGIGMFVHMHLRGKDMTFLAHRPDGVTETLLSVPNYNFDWQLPYRWADGAKRFPSGTKIECVAHYDNSAFNPYNPDPTKTVREGQQTFEEMMYGFFFYTDDDEYLNIEVDPKTGHVIDKPETQDQQASR